MADNPLRDLVTSALDLQGQIYEPGVVRRTDEGGHVAELKDLIEIKIPNQLSALSDLKIRGSIGPRQSLRLLLGRLVSA